MLKFTVWNTLSLQPNSNINRIWDCTEKSSLQFWIIKAVLRKVFLLCRLFCWTCFSWSFRHCLSGINRLNHCWDSWWIQKREKSQNTLITVINVCTVQLKTDISCIIKSNKSSLKLLSAYEGFKFPLLFHTLTQTGEERLFQIVWMLKGRWWCFWMKPKKGGMRKERKGKKCTPAAAVAGWWSLQCGALASYWCSRSRVSEPRDGNECPAVYHPTETSYHSR